MSDNIALTAKRMTEAEKLFDWALEQKANECILEKDDNSLTIDFSLASQNEYILYHLLSPYRFSPSQIQQIAENDGEQSGKEWRSASHVAMMDRNRLLVCRLEERRKPMIVPELGKYVFTEKQVLSFQYVKKNADFHINKQKNVACLDADLVEFPLTIRYVENGDRFVPFGMKGSKLVSDFLTNCKVSLYDKRQQLVVTDAHQRIIWLVNHRPHHHYCVTEETKGVLIISTI